MELIQAVRHTRNRYAKFLAKLKNNCTLTRQIGTVNKTNRPNKIAEIVSAVSASEILEEARGTVVGRRLIQHVAHGNAAVTIAVQPCKHFLGR